MAYTERILRERYRTVAEIGRGGMSVVHFAQDLRLGSYRAIKQVKNTSSEQFAAFLQEVELLASLSHSHIPRIVDRIEQDDDYFVVMDFISGTSLSKIVNMEGPRPEEKIIQWGVQLCDILDYLHTADPATGKKPVVYRDLKPGNAMLTPAGEIKLIDFGIAREYTPGRPLPGESLGTKGYAAPEQYAGAGNLLDARSDIYSLGATLYYLSTGFTPEIPPNGVPAVRTKNPNLSDSFEFVVAKCTADDPAKRYQSFAEVKADLENIKKLSGLYRKKMERRLILFWGSLILSVVFAVVGVVGYHRVQADLERQFQVAYQTAAAYGRDDDFLNAARYYAIALRAKPGDRETHVLLFEALLPREGGENARPQTKTAIDEMRKSYLDNTASPMYRDPQLCHMVVRRCIEVEDIQYARIALDYITAIKESEAYQEGLVSARELQAFEVIASFQSQDAASADFTVFNQTLLDLEDYTDSAPLSPDEQLGNYYMLTQMLTTYPHLLPDAHARAYDVGAKARFILAQNASNDSLAFNNIVPLYELIAVGQYNSASLCTNDQDREQAYRNSVEWFGYLLDLNAQLPERLALKRAHAYKGVFDVYNTPARRDRMDDAVCRYLYEAIGQYEEIIQTGAQPFLAYVYLTQACYDREMLLPPEERDFGKTYACYEQAKAMAEGDPTIPSTSIMQFASVTKQLQNAGLEV